MSPRRPRLTRPSAAIVALAALFGLLAATFLYSARATNQQGDAALLATVAGRQRADIERYIKDLLLVADGHQADPAQSLAVARASTAALAEGGEIAALQGGGELLVGGSKPSAELKAKIAQQQKLLDRLAREGEALQGMSRDDPGYEAAVERVRITGALLSSVTNDVVGQLTEDNQRAVDRLNHIQIAIALISGVAALGVATLFRREGRSRESARYQALATHSSDLVLVADPSGLVRYASPSSHEFLGRPPDEVVGTNLVDLVHPDDRELVVASLGEAGARTDDLVRTDYRIRHRDGTYRAVEGVWTNLLDDPSVGGLVANCRDVTERKVLEEELRRKAFLDDLTGLPNRALFGDRVEQALQRARTDGTPLTVLFVDLDGFKTVNDSMGHPVGDRLLVEVARRLEACVRDTDTAARLGGDEFGILLADGTSLDTAEVLAARVLAAVGRPFSAEGTELLITTSIGIACHPAPEATEDILRDADVAMYVAKAAGKGRYEVFAPRMHEEVVERQQLGNDLQRALASGELEVYYQPFVDLGSGALMGVEALLRWHHPTRGMVPPDTFIPLAEELGLIARIGAWVLEEACAQLGRWSEEHPAAAAIILTVNVSPHQLATDRLVHDVARAVEASGIEPHRLILEITEGALIGDLDTMVAHLHRLRDLGVRLAIDDFGTGYSSLSQLRRLPIDMLKIDRAFVDDAVRTDTGMVLLQSIVDLGLLLELQVVAEGIEEPGQADALRASGSHLGQGYFFARPAPPDALQGLIRSGSVPAAVPPADDPDAPGEPASA